MLHLFYVSTNFILHIWYHIKIKIGMKLNYSNNLCNHLLRNKLYHSKFNVDSDHSRGFLF